MEKTEIFDYMAANGHEKVLCFQNEDVGLRAVLAIHSTVLGPAAGGCRMWQYDDDLAAMEDALRLSKGMTYKYAAAGINLGGGKIVVIGDPKRQDGREMLFRALGRFIDSLGGEYLTGEDVGTTLQDMDHMRVETRNVITLPESAGGAGPIGPATAFGVL
ncbi:MAG: leucine dehydrogenase, partial [Ilumatobacteraceae bacterium]